MVNRPYLSRTLRVLAGRSVYPLSCCNEAGISGNGQLLDPAAPVQVLVDSLNDMTKLGRKHRIGDLERIRPKVPNGSVHKERRGHYPREFTTVCVVGGVRVERVRKLRECRIARPVRLDGWAASSRDRRTREYCRLRTEDACWC